MSIILSICLSAFFALAVSIELVGSTAISKPTTEDYAEERLNRIASGKNMNVFEPLPALNLKIIRQDVEDKLELRFQSLVNPVFSRYMAIYDQGTTSKYFTVTTNHPMIGIQMGKIMLFPDEEYVSRFTLNTVTEIFEFIWGKESLKFFSTRLIKKQRTYYSLNWIKFFWVLGLFLGFLSLIFSTKFLYFSTTNE